MPTYEYECQKCDHHFELFKSIKDESAKRCPKCKGRTKRLIGTGAGIIFKGSGFYMTDYRSKNYVEGAKKEKTDSGGGGSSGEKTDTAKTDTAKTDGVKTDGAKTGSAKMDSPKTATPPKEAKKTS
jgi:putative FmdB family regulatory protein